MGGRGWLVAFGVDFIGVLRFWGWILLTLADIRSPPNASKCTISNITLMEAMTALTFDGRAWGRGRRFAGFGSMVVVP